MIQKFRKEVFPVQKKGYRLPEESLNNNKIFSMGIHRYEDMISLSGKNILQSNIKESWVKMSKQQWKPGNMLYPLPVVMVSCGDYKGESNIITIAWAGTICTNPAMVSISVKKERYSHDIIKNSREFVINIVTDRLVYAADWCGVKSGRDYDKFEQMKLTRLKASHVACPMIEESPVNIECKVKEIKELGSHDMFIAEVAGVWADEKYMDRTGKFELNSSGIVTYSHGEYFMLGKKLGKFGYSVKKEKGGRKL